MENKEKEKSCYEIMEELKKPLREYTRKNNLKWQPISVKKN